MGSVKVSYGDVLWDNFALARIEEDWESCSEAACALLGWIDRNGIPPRCAELNAEHPDQLIVEMLESYVQN